jgi:heparan-alpha-glucosaminide N-acetyltransferase
MPSPIQVAAKLLDIIYSGLYKEFKRTRRNEMSTAAPTPFISTAGQSTTTRLASIDIFRGLTMVVMIFVNDLDSVHGLPWWTHHMPARINAMTYVDMVFPFFLFIIGLSIPLAIQQRLKKGPSITALWLHVVIRAASLIVLGLILANVELADPTRIGINRYAWAILGLAGASLFLSVYKGSERATTLHHRLRIFGLVLTAAMFAIFRRTTHDGRAAWIDGSYPEILGIIGYTYFAVAVLYIPTRRWLWAPLAWLVALVTMNAVCIARGNASISHIPLYIWPFHNGSSASITMAGIVTSIIFLGAHRWQTLRWKILLGLAFGFSALLAGWLFTPLGISKIRATPTWCLYSIGAAVLFFTLLYSVCDVKKKTAWAFFARPAGANTLLTYLIPDFYYFFIPLAGITYFETHLNFGWPGAVRSAIFTALVLAIAAALTKLKVRLQL